MRQLLIEICDTQVTIIYKYIINLIQILASDYSELIVQIKN